MQSINIHYNTILNIHTHICIVSSLSFCIWRSAKRWIIPNCFTQWRRMTVQTKGENLQHASRPAKETRINPSNSKAILVQRTRMQRSLKTILIRSCWYLLESSRRVLSDEYPWPGFRWFLRFLHHFVLAKLATSSVRVNQIKQIKLQHQGSLWLTTMFKSIPR